MTVALGSPRLRGLVVEEATNEVGHLVGGQCEDLVAEMRKLDEPRTARQETRGALRRLPEIVVRCEDGERLVDAR